MRRALSILLLLALSPASWGQAPVVTPPAGPVTYPAGTWTLTFAAPVTITQTANSITLTWGALPPTPTPTPTPVPPASTIPPNWKGDLFIIGFFDSSLAPTADQKLVQGSGTIAGSLTALAPTATTKWVASDLTNGTYSHWAPAKGTAAATLVVIATNAANQNLGSETIPLPANEAAVIAEIKRIRGVN
jgi:hypothetical protein